MGRERGNYEVGGAKLGLAIRTTRVFRKLDGRWRQVHRHGSIDNPEALKAYHKAVLGVELRRTGAAPDPARMLAFWSWQLPGAGRAGRLGSFGCDTRSPM